LSKVKKKKKKKKLEKKNRFNLNKIIKKLYKYIGEYCLRENENGVDINRNYDSHWE
jgi:hypothetical protein